MKRETKRSVLIAKILRGEYNGSESTTKELVSRVVSLSQYGVAYGSDDVLYCLERVHPGGRTIYDSGLSSPAECNDVSASELDELSDEEYFEYREMTSPEVDALLTKYFPKGGE